MEFFIGLGVFTLCITIAVIVDKVLEKQCKHDWQVIDKSDICYSSGPDFGQPYGWWYISKCKHCGKLKSEKFK